uniref:Uncharacterized protein n=1 Tax=candidate division WOR-3 bacterium TaxID=2052148 RepID=A0A7V3PUC0_UNCW3
MSSLNFIPVAIRLSEQTKDIFNRLILPPLSLFWRKFHNVVIYEENIPAIAISPIPFLFILPPFY